MNEPKALVIYYSRTRTTKLVAERISALTGADLEEIIDYENRLGLRGYVYSAIDATFARSTPIHELTHDPSAYDIVLIGTPVWNASVSAPVRRFLEEYGRGLKAVAFFCTMGGRGSERAFRQMRKICNQQPRAVLALRGSEVHRGLVRLDLETFAAEAMRSRNASPPATVEPRVRASAATHAH